jgi:hypothetical protein
MSKMGKRTITKEMQAVLESPEFMQTHAKIVDIMQKYRLFTAQLDETFERIRVPMQALNAALYDATSPLHGMWQSLTGALSQISEYVSSYEQSDAELRNIERGISSVINVNWDNSLMVENITTQIKCLKAIISEAGNGETIAKEMLLRVDEFEDPKMKSELDERISNLKDAKERATKLLDDKNALLGFLKKNRISGRETRFSYDNMYVSQLYDICEDNVLRNIQAWEFHMCVSEADYELIKERVISNQGLYYLLYLIGKIKNKVAAKERKQWCIQATESIGYSPTDTTKWRGNLAEWWLAQVDRIK